MAVPTQRQQQQQCQQWWQLLITATAFCLMILVTPICMSVLLFHSDTHFEHDCADI